VFKDDMILGIDIGSNSVGWALLGYDADSREVTGITDAGVRIFEAGMDGDISTGNATSRCAERRAKRLIRRNLDRRRRRMLKLQHILQRAGLLPEGDDIEKIILDLDAEVRKFCLAVPEGERPSREVLAHTYPYFLRALAINGKLPPHLLGRAVYHLAQRRGFWSNRKSLVDEKELGQVKQGISELRGKMEETGARTLGEYFAYRDPTRDRIRGLWTSRDMYRHEFDLIMNNHPHLVTPDLRKSIEKAIFFQRKLKSVKSLIGHCALEKNKRRCPWYRFEAQEFRILQTITNLKVIEPDGELRELSAEEWENLYRVMMGETGDLDRHGNIKISKAKKLLGLPKGSKFTIEDGGEKTLKGNKTLSSLLAVFGDSWNEFSPRDKEDILHDLRSFEKREPLVRKAMRKWNLEQEEAEAFADIKLPEDYCNLSYKALCKLLPLLREGWSYGSAVKEIYPEAFKSDGIVHELLPGLDTSSIDLRNPVVERSLTELRRVVNAVIRKYGKPGIIRLEMAREMKLSANRKKEIIKRNRDLEKQREKAAEKIRDVFPGMTPGRTDTTKVLLAEECGWRCPYTGRSISIRTLFGPHPQFDIEHIIPRSRSLDDSFLNKTLCYHEENRNVKRNRTPYEAYHGTPRYDEILDRVAKFNGRLAKEKLRRFRMTPEEVEDRFADFTQRQLNDTRYAAKEAAAYLGMLYGGSVTSIDGRKRVQVLSGGLTYKVRSAYNLNGILNDGDVKTRNDHRHHAVDAIAIGMTSPGMVKKLTEIAKELENRRDYIRFGTGKGILPDKWNTFDEDVRRVIGKIKVSHKIPRKVRGAFHEETFYSKEYEHKVNGKTGMYRHVRIPLENLEKNKIPKVVDKGVREAIIRKLDELGIDDPRRAFRNGENLPEIVSADGAKRIPIKKVKIIRKQNTIRVGEGRRARNVVPGNNHHMMIYAVLDKRGEVKKWDGEVVTLLEARRRLMNGEPLVNKVNTPTARYVMTVQRGDVFEMDIKGKRELVITRDVPQTKQMSFVRLNDARLKKEIKSSGEWFTKRPNSMRTSNVKKFTITPLGELRNSNA